MSINITRRRLLISGGVVGGGLLIGFSLRDEEPLPLPLDPVEGGFAPNALIQITPDNGVCVYCPRDEMGQGVTTGLTTLLAEELDVNPSGIQVKLARIHPDYNMPAYGSQSTGGSTSMTAHFLPLRQVGADTRAILVRAASQELGVPVDAITTEDGHVIVGEERYPYSQFLEVASGIEVPESVPLKDPGNFRYIGQEFPRLDGVEKSTGTAVFGIDVEIPGMHHAVVVRPAVIGSRLKGFDAEPVLRMPGVTDVVEISAGVAVVAQKYWQARKAAGQLSTEWEDSTLAGVNTESLRSDYQAALEEEEGIATGETGDPGQAFKDATVTLSRDFWAPYLAHAPLEPMNAVLRIEDGRADLWTGTQGPGIAQGLVARLTDLDLADIQVHSTYLGGGFGRRGAMSHIIEITEIVKAVDKPVKLLWSREDDMQNGFYRPASLMRLNAGLDATGRVIGWEAKRVGGNVGPDVIAAWMPGMMSGLPETPLNWMVNLAGKAADDWFVDPTSTEGLQGDYDFPNSEVKHVSVEHGLPLMFWRSVGHSYTAFAKEVMMDELAELAGQDPISFRLRNLEGNPRLARVVQLAGDRMGSWELRDGRTLGMASHTSFNSAVAQLAEVSVSDSDIRVHKVLCVIDCGRAINPDVVRAQMEGSIMFGLTATLHGQLDLENGAISQSNFHDYPILRMNEAPEVEVIIVDSQERPTGVGEPGLPPIAPAVANAVYVATGQRLHELPLHLV